MLKATLTNEFQIAISKSHWNQLSPLGDSRLLFWALASRNFNKEHLGAFRFWSVSFLPFLISKSLKEAFASMWKGGSIELRGDGPRNLSGLDSGIGTWSKGAAGRWVPLFESWPLEFYYKRNSLISC